MAGLKTLILGTAVGYGVAELQLFVRSARRACPSSDIVLIVDRTCSCWEFLDAHAVRPVYFESRHVMPTHINNARFFRYLDFLLDSMAGYDRIMLTDTRDVVFQSDPFVHTSMECVLFAQEDSLIADEPYNRGWLQQLGGQSLLDRLGTQYISCAGTVIGDGNNMLRYVSVMCDLLQQVQRRNTELFRTNIDQGLHNIIVGNSYEYFGNHASMPSNGVLFGTVGLTLARAPQQLSWQDNGLNVHGHASAVIHQYDRSAELATRMQQLHGS